MVASGSVLNGWVVSGTAGVVRSFDVDVSGGEGEGVWVVGAGAVSLRIGADPA